MKIVLLLILPCVAAALVQSKASQDASEDVWNRVIAAKGGAQLLRSVRALAWASNDPRRTSREFGSVRYEFVEVYPGRSWAWEDYRPGTLSFAVDVWNAEKKLHWNASDGGKAKALAWHPDSHAFRLRRARQHQVLFLLESADLRPVVRQVRRTADGLTVDLDVPGFASTTIVIGDKTFLPKSVLFVPDVGGPGLAAKELEEKFQIEEYSVIQGLMMPSRISELGELTFIINPDVDPKLFETPPDGVTSREAWKRYLR